MELITYFHLGIILISTLTWIYIITFLRVKKNKSIIYLILFTIFYVYLFKVLDYTLFQFQSLVILKNFTPNLMLNGISPKESFNLIPLIKLTPEDIKTSLLNILLMMPFGFGLPFIANFDMKKVIIIGILFSVIIELLQIITGLIAGITFRIADINDVIFNTFGVFIGYILFIGLVRILRH